MQLKAYMCIALTICIDILISFAFWEFLQRRDNIYYETKMPGTYIVTEHNNVDTDVFRDYTDLKKDVISVDITGDTAIHGISSECRRHFMQYTEALRQEKTPLWAVYMLDATGTWDSGIMEGNFIFEGRYSQCKRISISENPKMPVEIKGLYCLAYWTQTFPNMGLQSRGQGICIPHSCTDEDTAILFKQVYAPYLASDTEISMNCVRHNRAFLDDTGALWTVIFLSACVTAVLVATFYQGIFMQAPLSPENQSNGDRNGTENGRNAFQEFIFALSLYKTVPLITSTAQKPGAFMYLHGIRVFSMSILVLSHTYQLATFVAWPPTIDNRFTANLQSYREGWIQRLMPAGDLNVDTFFTISAFLMSLSLLKAFDKAGGNLSLLAWSKHYCCRYFRMVSSFALIMLVMTYLWNHLGNGPFMPDNLNYGNDCKQDWWLALLFINNLSDERPYCMMWGWYVCVDWQLFCVAPIFLYLLWRHERAGLTVIVATVLFIWTWYFVALEKHFVQESRERDIIVHTYIKPWFRFPEYAVGMLFGYLFYKHQNSFKPGKVFMVCGWLVVLPTCVVLSNVPWIFCDASLLCTVKVPVYMAVFYTLRQTFWACCICWLLYTCHTGYAGFINTILSWKFFVPLSSLSYQVYLINPILCLLFFYASPRQFHFTDHHFLYNTCGNLLLSLVLAFAMLAFFIVPLLNIVSLLGNKLSQTQKDKIA